MKLRHFIPLLALLAGCTREPMEEPVLTPDGFPEREMVPVKLYLGVAPMEYVVDGKLVDSPPETKANTGHEAEYNYQTQTADDTEIYNVWVLVFEQDGEQYVLNSQPQYIANYRSLVKDNEGNWLAEPETIDIPSSRYRCQLLFMANTGLPDKTFQRGITLEQFKEAEYAHITTQIDLFGYDDTAQRWAPRFNGTLETMVNTSVSSIGTSANPIMLKRAMARLDIRVINNSLKGTRDFEQRVHLRYVRVNNVQDRSFYYTNYADYATSQVLRRPATASPLSVVAADDWDMDTHIAADWGKIIAYSEFYDVATGNRSADQNPSPATILTGTTAPTDVSARFFLPGNVRAGDEGDATSVTLVGEYFDNSVTYQNVYNIPIREEISAGNYCYAVRPNHHYTITITIEQRGKTDTHYNDGLYDFTQSELANCYILNPPLSADLHRIFKFPVEKGNHFWGDSRYAANATVTTSSAPIGAKTGGDLVIQDTDRWWAEILWADFDYRGKVSFVDLVPNDGFGAGEGQGYNALEKGLFALQVQGAVKGNLVVAVKKRLYKDGDSSKFMDFVVWSYHMWITDYDPDATPTLSASGLLGTVPGGKIYRADNDFFRYGDFKNSYLMDRVIGAWDDPVTLVAEFDAESFSSDVVNLKRPGLGLYYQYGRKDPFPGRNLIYYPDGNGGVRSEYVAKDPQRSTRVDVMTKFSTLKKNTLKNALYYITDNDVQYVNQNVPLSVMYPMLGLISGTDKNVWTRDDQYNPAVVDAPIMWQDPYFYEHEDVEVTNNMGYHKSMFDPCPPGWTVQPRQFLGSVSTHHYYVEDIDKKVNDRFVYWAPIRMAGNGTRGFLFWPDGRPNEIVPSTYSSAIFMPYLGYMSYNFMNHWNDGTNNNYKNIYNWLGYPASNTKAYRVNFNRGKELDRGSMNNGERYLSYQTRCLKNNR